MIRRKIICAIVGIAFTLQGVGCSTSTESLVESAQFHLDRYEYAAALSEGEAALAQSPSYRPAQIVVALALVGLYFLGPNRTNVGFLADLARSVENGNGLFRAFLSAAYEDSETAYGHVTQAQDILLQIPPSERGADVYLEIYVIRLFEIALLLDFMGVFSPDSACNANPANPLRDGVPDALAPNNLPLEQADRLQFDLYNTYTDAAKAGLADFPITQRVKAASDSLEAAVAQMGDVGQAVVSTVNEAFGNDGTETICLIQ